LLVTRNPRLLALLLRLEPGIEVAAGERTVADLRDRGIPVTQDGVLFDAERGEAVYLATDLDDAGVWARADAVHATFVAFPLADEEACDWLRQWLAKDQCPGAAPDWDMSTIPHPGVDPDLPGYPGGPTR
jgi:hypothetical protein